MKALTGKSVLITGASAGIGAALARGYAQRGANVILTARRLDRLETMAEELGLYNRKILPYAADVTRDGEMEKAVASALKEVPSIDIVIANAGFCVMGKAEELSLADYQRQFETNVYGVLRTFHATLDALKRSRGHFAVIGSVNGYISLPGNSAYGMSKHAVRAFTDSLFHEVRPYGVRVTHISPGFIDTEIRRVNNDGKFLHNAKDPIPKWLMETPERAAATVMKAVDRGVRECAVTAHGWFLIRLMRYFPKLSHAVIRFFSIAARPQPK